jgi:hypothetical protein
MSGPPNSNWKHPSVQHQQKYGLVDLPDDFEPTVEETMLLDMYKTVQTLDRQAAKLKEEAARAKLTAAEAEFNKRSKPKAISRAPKAVKKGEDVGIEDSLTAPDTGNVDDEAGDEQDESFEADRATLHERREARLEALRLEVEEAKQLKQTEEDALRQQLLQEQEPVLDGPLLKRRKIDPTDEPTKSLIANLTSAVTPPHDFSKKLNISVTQGRVLYPTSADQTKWSPPSTAQTPNEGAFTVRLTDFDMAKAQIGQGNNTLAIKFAALADAKRFSLNIATPENLPNMDSVLFHFNPRHFERGGQVILNDKNRGIWGQHLAIPLSQVPLIFGQTSTTLLMQITAEGFDVFLGQDHGEGDGLVHVARWEHRKELGNGDLVLQFPSTDDYGALENWFVYKVWWGHQPVRAKENAQVAGVNNYNTDHPRKLFVSGLTKVNGDAEVDVRRAELERAFRKFGGDRGVTVIAPNNSTYAFIEMEDERQADLALSEMSSHYKLNRARRSRHEALQDERAAKEAGAHVQEPSDWD